MNHDDAELLERKIREFSCKKDTDVESFIKEKSMIYERSGLSRTYLYFAYNQNRFDIVAYFSVAITATSFEGISKSRKAKVLGGKPGRETKDHFGGLLVAQLGRNDSFSSLDISGTEMIADAEKIIEKGRYYLGGKIVYLDCRESLIHFYQDNGYSLLKNEVYPSGYYKMFKTLPRI
ncbi:hypothetical protein AGMMS49983_17690 [Clostridia bacterium]|nr:hypothetical protein AGMMS49983_17690 [Clostridia bacterium]